MDGLLMIAMNKHREICSIQSSGGIMLLKEQVRGRRVLGLFLGVLAFTNFKISEKKRGRSSEQLNKLLNEFFYFLFLKVMRCSKIASVKVSEITELINQALMNDKKAR